MTITIIRQAPSATEAHIRYTQENVTLHVTPVSTLIQHPGTLFIADECLYYFSTASNAGFAIPYPSIIIHAIARESHVGPSIYCQLEGSLASSEPAKTNVANGHSSNGTSAEKEEEEEDEEEDAVLELSFVPADVSSLDTIYENLSYCASLHQDEEADDDYLMDEDALYEDDENDHDGLFADADIQGGYIPKSSSTTAIGVVAPPSSSSVSSSSMAAGVAAEQEEIEQVPAIDLQSGEWYTGNPETDAKFELSEQGQVTLHHWQQNQSQEQTQTQGKRGRQDLGVEAQPEDQDMATAGTAVEADGAQEPQQEYTEEQVQEARSKMWRAY
ncbi:regulator of volume decrease after cellular swelling-domain-containing protein [Gamsiella multidivaricata]|uniref:regulator of volume decrease after cellular swelling-domain-containing protein n=1 Tax=Gamsiella multidivaricata TaxID=101098 RepID=UPI0022208500|nr:regulator of volume decrease after cellular swelling-domain-containing protein [Gamsiella multidivaricata]KAI7821540.1 regulator of volume decrease after cellular swelling-domain-containing protein [Gamsiella multidivaricata]